MIIGNKDVYNEEESKSGFTLKEKVLKYLSYWPLFVLSLLLSFAIGNLYIYVVTPKYKVSALILVKGGGIGSSSKDDLIENSLKGGEKKNLDNELQLMRSQTLMERVVSNNQFNISYYINGKIRKTNIYLNAPFRLIPQDKEGSIPFNLILAKLNSSGGTIIYGPEQTRSTFTFAWNTAFIVNGKKFVLVPHGSQANQNVNYVVSWRPTSQTAEDILKSFSVGMLDNKTTIILAEILVDNLTEGKDILNAISKEYNLSDIEERNTASQTTIRFIDDRLSIISNQLSGVEENLENYQGNNEIIEPTLQSTQSFSNQSSVSGEIEDLNVQQGVVDMLRDYFNNQTNQGKIVPSTLGIKDATLSYLIGQYNDLQLRKEKEGHTETTKSIVMKELNNQISDVKGSILENLQNITKNIEVQKSKLSQQNNRYQQFISALPRKKRGIKQIERKQSITEGLYLYLLQKREEAAISSSSANISYLKQIDPATGYGPVEPNKASIRIFSILIGLLLPFSWISLKDLFYDKVISRFDVARKTSLPIIGELSHVSKSTSQGLSVMKRDIIGEQFRIIRTNISISQKQKDKQVFLVTSSVTGEGKTFVSLNLAAVLAFPGKKVALLELDMRKPGLSRNLRMNTTNGIANFLNGQIDDISTIYQVSNELPTLHIFPCGTIPPNAGDLLLSERVKQLFFELKQQYDYIIVDTAPVGLVSDAFILGEYSDTVIYIIRQRYTLKKQLEFVNEIFKNKKLNNISLIINDVRTGGKYGASPFGFSPNNEYYSNDKLNGKSVLGWNKKKTKVVQ
jgi:capsular exopolysaccharide synthesis family protein